MTLFLILLLILLAAGGAYYMLFMKKGGAENSDVQTQEPMAPEKPEEPPMSIPSMEMKKDEPSEDMASGMEDESSENALEEERTM